TEAGLVTAEDRGRERHYALARPGLAPVRALLDELAGRRPPIPESAFDALDLEGRRTVHDRRAGTAAGPGTGRPQEDTARPAPPPRCARRPGPRRARAPGGGPRAPRAPPTPPTWRPADPPATAGPAPTPFPVPEDLRRNPHDQHPHRASRDHRRPGQHRLRP